MSELVGSAFSTRALAKVLGSLCGQLSVRYPDPLKVGPFYIQTDPPTFKAEFWTYGALVVLQGEIAGPKSIVLGATLFDGVNVVDDHECERLLFPWFVARVREEEDRPGPCYDCGEDGKVTEVLLVNKKTKLGAYEAVFACPVHSAYTKIAAYAARSKK